MYDELHALLAPWGQEHLLAFWNDLDRQRQASLAAEIRGIDFELIERLYGQRDAAGEVRELADRACRPPVFRVSNLLCASPWRPTTFSTKTLVIQSRRLAPMLAMIHPPSM